MTRAAWSATPCRRWSCWAGFSLRAWGVSESGLAEDEVNKLEAVRAYGRGDFAEDAAHPMVMKALIRSEPGAAFLLFMFLFRLAPCSLFGAKWLRYTLSLMPFV